MFPVCWGIPFGVLAVALRDAADKIPTHAVTLTEAARHCECSPGPAAARMAVKVARAAAEYADVDVVAAERASEACPSDGAVQAEVVRSAAAYEAARTALDDAEALVRKYHF